MNSSTGTLCRICLEDGATIPIFEDSRNRSDSTIQSKISLCLNEKLEDVVGYPRHICNNCQMTLNTVFDFIIKYKETCKILQERLQLVVKQEKIEFDDYDYPEDDTVETFEVKSNKRQIKIEFDDGSNLLAKIKPLCKLKTNENNKTKILASVKKKETATKKKVTPIKKKTTLKKKKTVKRPHIPANSINKLNRIKLSLLEGEFVWNGEDWCLKTPLANKTLNNNQVALVEDMKEIPCEKPKPEKKSEPVLCEACGETFKNRTKLKFHEEKKHKNLATCPKCNMTLASAYYLARHMKRIHSDVKNCICSNCGKAFAFEKDLRCHIKVVHKRLGIKPIKRVSCKLCDKEYCNKSALRVHERAVHTGERPAVCTVCDASFFGDEYLRQHMRLHTGECPYKCPVCGRGYSQSCNMKSHMRNHRISELDQETLSRIKPSWHKFMKP